MARRRFVLLLPACLVIALASSLSASASAVDPDLRSGAQDGKSMPWLTENGEHNHDHDRPAVVDRSLIPSVAAAASPCVGGFAGEYPCRNVDLLSNLPLASMGGGSGSAGWGWTDPSNGKEYAIVGRTNGTAFVDVSNPASPVYLGNLPTATGTASWRELAVHNNHVYIVSDNNGAHGMQIFNLTRLRGVTSPQTFAADARNTSFGRGHTIHINNETGFAYVNGSDTCSGGPRMFNLANPTNPAFVGCVSADGYTHDSQAVIYNGPQAAFRGREILAASNEDTLTIFDVTNKAAPVQLARKGYAGRGYTHQGRFTEDFRYFIVDDELDETNFGHNGRTYVWDMANLNNPVLIGNYTASNPASDHNQFIKGNFSYQANYRAGLRIIDLTNVANPSTMTEAGFFDVDPTSNANGFAGAWHLYPYLPSGNVLVFSIQRGLFVVKPNLGGGPGPTPTTVFSDTFEAANGWVTNPNGTDTATSGVWERGDPEQATSGATVTQLGTTVSGTNDLVTGRLLNGAAGANDIDGGVTSIQSPAIALPATGTLTLNLSYYFAHLNNASNGDSFRISVVHAGGTTVVFQQLGAATNRAAAFAAATANLTPYAGQSIRILITAADTGTASLVEAGVDDVRIVRA